MRHTIETAPRNGNVIILEDDANGTFDVAHWSPEAGEWVGGNGEPSEITPSHWHPCYSVFPFSLREDAPQPPTASNVVAPRSAAAVAAQLAPSHARRGFAISWNAATLVAAVLVGIYFQLAVLQLKQAAETATADLRQSLQQEHDRAEALATELAQARRDVETQVALSSKRSDEAAQLKQATESATADLRQSLQQERDRVEALTTELTQARRDVETQVALSGKSGDEAAQLKQAAESATADLRQSLQQEHDRTQALATELAQARRAMEQKPAAVEEKPAAMQSEGMAPENSKPAIKPVETVPPKLRAMNRDDGHGCRHYRTYDPASGTYKGYDGQRHSCP
jgi:septal ring factor EnvC (AmiA/AmiB activator)